MDKNLIRTVNQLQDAFAALGATANPIDLPQIAVVGSQSSGKSSVLENIVGRDFLPRGSGIVTRRPLVLQLTNVTPGRKEPEGGLKPGESADEWGEFLHCPGKKFYDFSAIRDEIVAETDRKTGKNVGISPDAISLRIFSPNVLTLTLVDLPGMTKVPVGDQPPDIERQIREMILQYISKPKTIILSVNAANTDLANSDGLKLAREVDPRLQRTIGVLTKIDLMDQGTDVVDILAQRVVKVWLGWVPVINRGQNDINNNKSIQSALDFERNYFENHPAYRANAAYCGTSFLARKLNTTLMKHIERSLPETKLKISAALSRYRDELEELGTDLGNPANALLAIITDLTKNFTSLLEGTNDDLSTVELAGGARVSFVLHELYSNGVKAIDPFEQVKDVDIRTILYNSSGSTPSLFVATSGFEVIVKQQISRFQEPSLRAITLVYEELVSILSIVLNGAEFKRYPQLRDHLHMEAIEYLQRLVNPTRKLITDMVAMEAAYVNTGHPDFIDGHQAMEIVSEKYRPKGNSSKTAPPPATTVESVDKGFFGSFFSSKSSKRKMAAMEAPPAVLKATGQLSERESMETDVIKLLIQSYFNIVKRTATDMVPKAIMLNLVEKSKRGLQSELLQKLYASGDYENLMKESDFFIERRRECQKMVSTLERAQEIIAGVQM